MSEGKKIGRHDRMLSMLADSSDDDAEAPPTKKVSSSSAPAPSSTAALSKKKAQQAAMAKFGAALADSSDSEKDDEAPTKKKAAAPTPTPSTKLKPSTAAAPTTVAPSTASKPKPATPSAVVASTKSSTEPAAKKKTTDTEIPPKPTATAAEPDASTAKKSLFDDDDDDDEEGNTLTISSADAEGISKKALASIEGGISINKNYADKYDAVKRKQELQRLAEKYKVEYDEEESDETDEEEDEFGDNLNEAGNDEMWAEVFYKLRQKDPTITDKSVGFFKDLEKHKSAGGDDDDSSSSGSEDEDGNKKGKKKYTLKDEYRKAMMGGEAYDSVALATIEEEERPGRLKPRTAEERAAKAAFLSVATNNNEEGEEEEDIIVKKVDGKSSADIYGGEKKKAEDAKKKKAEDKKKKHVDLLAEAFTIGAGASPEEQNQENFLRSFFTNEKWRDANDSDSEDDANEFMGAGFNKKGMKHGDVDWEQIAKEDQDEMFFDEAEQWEREYQEKHFHHEMVDTPEDLQVKTFPRRTTLANQNQAAAGNVSTVAISTLKSVAGEEEHTVRAIVSGGDGLLRKHESTRAEQRRRRLERAKEAEAQRVEELKRLKTLKRLEIEEKRDMIARVAGFLKGGTKGANTNDDSIEEFNLENPFAVNSTDPKDDKKKKKGSSKKDGAPPVEGNAKLLEQLTKVWSNEELEKDFDAADFDKKMAALFDTDEFNNDIDEEEIARIRAEIEADDVTFGGDEDGAGGDDEDDDADGEALADELLHEEVGVGYGDEGKGAEDGLFYGGEDEGEGDDEDEDDGILGDDELFGGLSGVAGFDKKKGGGGGGGRGGGEEEEDNDGDDLYSAPAPKASSTKDAAKKASSKAASALGEYTGSAADEDDDLTALLYPTKVLSKMEHDAAKKITSKQAKALEISAGSSKADLEAYMGTLQKELDSKVEEYNKLHYDKVLSGGLKTRFRYRTVNPENFGLTDEDILTKDDRTLNMIAPMKLYAPYLGSKENKRDRQRCVLRLRNLRMLDPTRRSRRYGDVSKTILFDPSVPEEEGRQMAARVRLSTRKLLANKDAAGAAEEAEKILKEVRSAKGRGGGQPATAAAAKEGEGGEGASTSSAAGAAPKRAREDDGGEGADRDQHRSRPPHSHQNNNNFGERRGGFSRGGNNNFRGGRGFSNGGSRGGGNSSFSRGGGGSRGGAPSGGGSFRGGGRGGFTPRGGRQ